MPIIGTLLFHQAMNTNRGIFAWKTTILVIFFLPRPFLQIYEGHWQNLLYWLNCIPRYRDYSTAKIYLIVRHNSFVRKTILRRFNYLLIEPKDSALWHFCLCSRPYWKSYGSHCPGGISCTNLSFFVKVWTISTQKRLTLEA